MIFSGPEIDELKEIVLDAFEPEEIRLFLRARLDKRFNRLVSQGSKYDYQIFSLLERSQQEGWLEKFVRTLLTERPFDQPLLAFALKKNLLTESYGAEHGAGLEAVVNGEPTIIPEVFLEGLHRTKRCICRISIDKGDRTKYGTGFLVGPDLVLTNYHVVNDLIKQPELAASTVCKFDYEVSADGVTLNSGLDIQLAPNPILANSPFCKFDEIGTASVQVDWPADALDYALLKLKTAVGEQPFGFNAAQAGNDAPKRGWISPAVPAIPLESGGSMLILQHPAHGPLQLAIGFNKIIALDNHQRRVRYEINTRPGSSGAPCFDLKFNWSALHNVGDPDEFHPAYNQGIPAVRIIEDLAGKQIVLS